MTIAAADIVCIYCKMTKPRPSRSEHVVLDGLGGTTCIRDVCHKCNEKLARLDQDFLRNVMGLRRHSRQHAEIEPSPPRIARWRTAAIFIRGW